MRALIGTSGWQYKDWRGRFYPERLPQRDWLPHYAARFDTVEVNNTFYRLPPAETFARWAEQTPDDFVVVVKASRYLSHIKRLKDPADPVDLLMERARPLGPKLGPVLVQLPPNFGVDCDRLDETLSAFDRHRVRVAVEFRHESWFDDSVYDVLEHHDAALCLTDRLSKKGPVVTTADWTYLRLHEGTATPHPCYGRGALEGWAQRLAAMEPRPGVAYVFFNNDPRGCAVANAREFALAAAREGMDVSTVPDAADVRAG